MKDFLRSHAPKLIWSALSSGKRSTISLATDAANFVRGLPRRSLARSIGDGDFVQIGNEFLAYFKDYAYLSPDEHVLDVGCGVGRMAIPLTKYMSKSGSYDGFDIVRRGIDWCDNHITPRYSNFHFHFVDVWNKRYNPNGHLRAKDFRFPFNDAAFDFVFLTSVFTHMLQDDVEHYLSEISRVLKPNGRCFVTWFLLNDESKQHIQDGKSSLPFAFPIVGGLTTNQDIPEAATAYEEADVIELYLRKGIKLTLPIHYGSWCGRSEHLSYQDICIGHKL